MSQIDLAARLDDLLNHIATGRIIDAMHEFYADSVVMAEPYHTTEGLAANVRREEQFLAGVKEWKGFDVTAKGVGDGVTFYECTMDWVATDGSDVHVEQAVVARWENGKIVHERFYYDTGAK